MLTIKYTAKMKRDTKRMKKRGKDMSKLVNILDLLATDKPMPEKYQDHHLIGNMKDFRECHIEPNWLPIYRIFENTLVLSASGTGTHSDLFDE
ncbi:MAG: type II toxin-antitoxin system YafQ family toxin [Clostridiales bacterium]|jgi:mRNA interferase YafQ|nr:type II toxin-antitoxin system YafQ family toxin [Clostridiales bacterium]